MFVGLNWKSLRSKVSWRRISKNLSGLFFVVVEVCSERAFLTQAMPSSMGMLVYSDSNVEGE